MRTPQSRLRKSIADFRNSHWNDNAIPQFLPSVGDVEYVLLLNNELLRVLEVIQPELKGSDIGHIIDAAITKARGQA